MYNNVRLFWDLSQEWDTEIVTSANIMKSLQKFLVKADWRGGLTLYKKAAARHINILH